MNITATINNSERPLTQLWKQSDTQNRKNLLICLTGSVAIIKLPHLMSFLAPHFNIKIVATKHSQHFLHSQQFKQEQLKIVDQNLQKFDIFTDQKEWKIWLKRGDPVLHIQLRKWADCMLIAPLGANSLAKLASGICDNLVTLVCRAWPMNKKDGVLAKPIVVCPSMNSLMWEHPVTAVQINVLKQWGYEIIGPVSKKMMCGEIGNGAMAEVKQIGQFILRKLNLSQQKGEAQMG